MSKNSPGLKSEVMYKVIQRFKGGTVHEYGPYSKIGYAKGLIKNKRQDMIEWNSHCAPSFVRVADFEIYATDVNWVMCDQEESS